jgi:hypothetical protein
VFFSVFQHHLKTTTNTCQRVQEMWKNVYWKMSKKTVSWCGAEFDKCRSKLVEKEDENVEKNGRISKKLEKYRKMSKN